MNNEGSFMWAVEQLSNGKQVKRKAWDKLELGKSIGFNYVNVCRINSTDIYRSIDINDIQATDWIMFDKYDKLCDAIILPSMVLGDISFKDWTKVYGNAIYYRDVKSSLNRFIKKLEGSGPQIDSSIRFYAKEIFGEGLIE